jgi:hypothetical protein
MIAEDAVAGGYASKCRHDHTVFDSCLAHFQLAAAEQDILDLGAAIWGDQRLKGVCFFGSMR